MCVGSVIRKRSATTAIGTAISPGTADQDVDQGLAHSIVIAAVDTLAPDPQEMTGDATTEMKGGDLQIATVIVVIAMTARKAMTVTAEEDAMIAVAATVQTSGGPNITTGNRGVRVEKRTEGEEKEIALGAEVLMKTKTTGGDLNPEKEVSWHKFELPILILIRIPLTKVS